MDGELWASLLSATQRRFAVHPYHLDRPLSRDDLEAYDDMQIEFACPSCFAEFDIGSLCLHIEEEHRFEPKAAVCPVCAVKVKNDLVGHITSQHGHLFKMQRRRFQMAVTSVGSALSSLLKDRGVVALQSQLSGNSGYWLVGNTSQAGIDPLANLLCGLPLSEVEAISKTSGTNPCLKECLPQRASSASAMSAEECKQQVKETALRAMFVQQLVLSSVFKED